MTAYNLDKVFKPGAVAVIGASERPGRIGYALMKNLIEGCYQGKIIPVNPKYSEVMGYRSIPSMTKQEESVDLALVAVPISEVPKIIAQCSAAEVKTAIIISAGGKEIGETGAKIESQIASAASCGKMRIIGPNCLGVMAPHTHLNASFSAGMPLPGNLAFISQSGAVCTAILDLSFKEGIGFSHFVSIGSMVDVDFGDMIDYLGMEPKVKSILLYVEQLTNIRKFMSAARSVSRIKPIFVLKAGSSVAGALAAASHTGALAGEDAVYDAAFERAGVIRVHTIEELFDCAELMAKYPVASGPGMAVITNGGGPGVMAVDAIVEHGLHPAILSQTTLLALDELLPRYWSRGNPVDILGDASATLYGQVISLLLQDKRVHGLMVILAPQAMTDPLMAARALIAAVKGKTLPVFAVWMGGRDVEAAIHELNAAGIATYSTPERAVNAFGFLVRHRQNLQLMREIPARFDSRFPHSTREVREIIDSHDFSGPYFVSEKSARNILQAYNISCVPVRYADSSAAAAEAAEKIGWPVALKIVSPDISHKTDARGVQLNLQNRDQLHRAYTAIMEAVARYSPDARLEGVSVQPYIANPDVELLIGVKHNDAFGPVVVFGMGGTFAEVIADRALAFPPLNRLLIRRLIFQTKASRLLSGYRNITPPDADELEELIHNVSQLVVDNPEVAELDINPVIIKDGKLALVDARLHLKPPSIPAPFHLIISPYPAHYEQHAVTKTGLPILIRPIQPEDASLFLDLFSTLSPTSVYHRFFAPIKEISPDMLAMLTQVDYDRHMALVALDRSVDAERMLGVGRIIKDPATSVAEFAVLVGDPWQGVGIGAQLLLLLLKIARDQGIEKIWGTVLRENRQMLNLGKKLGFHMTHNSEDGTYDLTFDIISWTDRETV